MKYLVGVDEVGRGPLAGPVAVCALMVRGDLLRKLGRIRDSKGLSEAQRKEWFIKVRAFQKDGDLDFAVTYAREKTIDTIGIVPAVRRALSRSLQKLEREPSECLVLLDGGLEAPEEYENQETIIRGDATETIIALASIVAKVYRDRRMIRLSKKYPGYGFEKHKGYGTRAHYEALQKFGSSPIHRLSFLSKIISR